MGVAKMVESVAIVTGASQGIGRATAIRLSSSFSAIVLVARNTERLVETANKVKSAGAEALVLALDLARPEAAEYVVTRTIEEFGRIDAVVHIAGAVPVVDLFEMTNEQWDGGIALKFHAAPRLSPPEMPTAPYAAVGAINAAIVALAKSFADRGIEEGVWVNSVLPGPDLTDRRRAFIEQWAPAHGMTVDEGMRKFSTTGGNQPTWSTGGNCRPDRVSGVALYAWDDWKCNQNRRRRSEGHLREVVG